MSTTAVFESISIKTSVFLRKVLHTYGEYKNIYKKKNLIQSVHLSSLQEANIKTFYKAHFGKCISTKWHRLYQSYTGTFNIDYFPEILFSTLLEPKTNPYRIAELFGDKNLIPKLFQGIPQLHIPYTYISKINGHYQDENDNYINIQDVEKLLYNMGPCIIKKSIDTSSGRDVQICDFKNGKDEKTGKTIYEILKIFGNNFVVQELIEQFDSLSKLNGTSVNTFRVMTYILDNNIYHCPLVLRLGRSNADRDNIHYGGLCIGMNDDGTLMTTAFSEYGERYTKHPDSNVEFAGYQICPDCYKKINNMATFLHQRMPYLGILSWDLTIDKEGNVTIIEVNTTGQSAWFPQMIAGKPLFGENTSRVLQKLRQQVWN